MWKKCQPIVSKIVSSFVVSIKEESKSAEELQLLAILPFVFSRKSLYPGVHSVIDTLNSVPYMACTNCTHLIWNFTKAI